VEARLEPCADLEVDVGTGGVIGLERFAMDRGQKFDRHVHEDHQLVWASSGVLTVEVEDRYWVLPTTLALWVPAGVLHASAALRESVMEGIYLDPARTPLGWERPTVVAVSPLARELIGHLGHELDEHARARAEGVLMDVLAPVQKATIEVPMPTDPRAREVAQLVMADPADPRGLDELARHAGASSRTLLRLFLAQTGVTFSAWRTSARLQASMALLADGHPVSQVAYRVGYGTPSAFIAAFHRATGHTPGAYFRPEDAFSGRPQRAPRQSSAPSAE
jgi:AraC-like DNA-binding protein/quercetin dioxygenase-like cupin family protein